MLETIREYAHLKLVEANELTVYRDYHLDYIAQLAAEFEQKVHTPESAASHLKLDPEIANLRLAIEWALGREEYDRAAEGISIVYALERFWHNRAMLGEVLDWCLRGLEILPKNEPRWMEVRAFGSYIVSSCFVLEIRKAEPRLIEYFLQESQQTAEQLGNPVLMSWAKLCQAYYLCYLKESETHLEACAVVKESVDIIRKTNNRVQLTFILIFGFQILNAIQGEAVAKPYLDEAYTIALETGDPNARIMSFAHFQNLAFAKGEYETASKYNLAILAEHKEDRSQQRIAERLTQQGLIEFYLHDFPRMEAYFQESFDNYSIYADPLRPIYFPVFFLRMLGLAQLRQGKFQSAKDMLLKGLAVSPNEEYYNIPVTMIFLSGLYLETGQPEQAVLLLGFAEKQLENALHPFDDWDKVVYERITAQARAAMDIETFTAAWEAGKVMTLAQALAYAKEVTNKGKAG
jgi:tetratricopeptide (TPR) repeat protein